MTNSQLFLRRRFAPADGGFGARADRALDGDIQERRPAGGKGSLQRRREIFGPLDKLTIAAQALHDLLVTSLEQICGNGPAVKTELNLPVDAPRRIVAEYGDDDAGCLLYVALTQAK